jgi:hypothetical protein
MICFVRYVLPVLVTVLMALTTPSPTPVAVPEVAGRPLVDLLPESTVAAVEIRDLSRRWTEIRDLPGVARFQDRVFRELGLDVDALPLLAGDRAVLALVISENGRASLCSNSRSPVKPGSPCDPSGTCSGSPRPTYAVGSNTSTASGAPAGSSTSA